ncbi:tellurium resistance protein [Thioclava dalianensis]|uniref:Tellurium resistance protein n=1 Tax=Thioclava dalianensis TaxID=1185766 RepID=A0A074TIM3_9RHOB|nr:hypothetical protein [Thioclava dalianensis]KEP70015.1 tellurium resistance protein [Thioclava dalianensis]SFN53546.1 tellurite resistance protein [Thioclava dalianensis]
MTLAPRQPTPQGLFRRTPPAAFLPVLGLIGLVLVWRRGIVQFALPQALAEIAVGAVSLLVVFCLIAYGVKLLRRPRAIFEDLRVLPGRAGIAALVLASYLLAAALAPYGMGAQALFWAALIAHLGLIALIIWAFFTGPTEQRRVTPVSQLSFAGFGVAALVAQALGLGMLGVALFWIALLVAVPIWVLSMQKFSRETVPAPLRPLLACHLVPAAILGMVAAGFHAAAIAQVMALISGGFLVLLVVRLRWLLAAGESPLWGALCFPLAATAGCWLAVGGYWARPGAVLLIVATLVIVPLSARLMKGWSKGDLALKTNAAIA